ncbi:MAG TPA: hypothetical protein ENJ51_05865 [Leucothrix mucor]|uniref:Lipoprotein n=1 Tax=Leucothrix mucor TaxID=45248 RepID=A0A7V2T2T2_LEUMU|nr:hypothetical protein [Leucothrix mucor]
MVISKILPLFFIFLFACSSPSKNEDLFFSLKGEIKPNNPYELIFTLKNLSNHTMEIYKHNFFTVFLGLDAKIKKEYLFQAVALATSDETIILKENGVYRKAFELESTFIHIVKRAKNNAITVTWDTTIVPRSVDGKELHHSDTTYRQRFIGKVIIPRQLN